MSGQLEVEVVTPSGCKRRTFRERDMVAPLAAGSAWALGARVKMELKEAGGERGQVPLQPRVGIKITTRI